MVTLFAKHAVNDYSTWKRGYDGLGPTRQAMGVSSASVHRDPNDANMITITHEFKDFNAAVAFANSAELQSAMMNAGVVGRPEIWFAEDVEHTPF